MTRLLNYFLKGIVFLAPIAFTVYVCYRLFTEIDGWLNLGVPGAGFLATLAFITLFGFLAEAFLTRRIFGFIDRVLERLPFVRLLYSSARDLLNAFVGEHRRFDKPVLVSVHGGGAGRAIGFVTQESLVAFGMQEYVTVYLPFSYSIAGTLLIFPASAVTPLPADSPEVMAFIVSGGVTTPPPVRRP